MWSWAGLLLFKGRTPGPCNVIGTKKSLFGSAELAAAADAAGKCGSIWEALPGTVASLLHPPQRQKQWGLRSGYTERGGKWGDADGGTLSLPQGVLHGAEVQWGQTLVAPQVGVRLVLQQQLDAVGVPPQAGFVQGPLSPQRQVGVGPSAEEMAQAGGVTPAGDEAQWGGQLPLVLQRPQPCGVEGAGLMPRADLLGSPARPPTPAL